MSTKKFIAIWNVEKVVTSFNSKTEDWSGPTTDFGIVDNGHTWVDSEKELADIIQERLGLTYPFELFEEGRYETNQTEDGDAMQDDKGKYLADYSLYFELFVPVKVAQEVE